MSQVGSATDVRRSALRERHADHFKAIVARIEARLEALSARVATVDAGALGQAMAYSLDSGKRLRPLMTVIAAEAFGASSDVAIDSACAIEMIHTASLILDDLPCMDDARQRRGKAANHVAFGEDVAILASVSLLTEAFGTVARDAKLSSDRRVDIQALLARTVGVEGLAAGQVNDLRDEGPVSDVELAARHRQKTGVLFVACIQAGALAADVIDERLGPLEAFGERTGLSFQMLDDLLDVVGQGAWTGKDTGADTGKVTFATNRSVGAVEKAALEELEAGLGCLDALDIDPSPFEAFVDLVVSRYYASRDGTDMITVRA